MCTSFALTRRKHFRDLQFDDLHQVGFRQLMEDDDVIESVDELRLKTRFASSSNLVAHRFVLVFAQRLGAPKAHRRLPP
jgi:hypothetical protein